MIEFVIANSRGNGGQRETVIRGFEGDNGGSLCEKGAYQSFYGNQKQQEDKNRVDWL